MNPRKKIYISIIVFAIISVFLIALVLVPLLTNIKKNSDELISQKRELAQTEKDIKTFEETESIYEKSKEEINKINKLFYDQKNPLEFLDFLTEKPKIYGLQNKILKIIPPDLKPQTDSWKIYSFQISSTGSFTSLMKFINSLESGPYLIEILNINIKKSSGEGLILQGFSLGDTSASLSIKVYSK
jgi:hypothetical protein